MARLIITPKNGACIEADSNLDKSRTSKFGAVAATILLIMNIEINMINNNLGGNFKVSKRMIGPKNATLKA